MFARLEGVHKLLSENQYTHRIKMEAKLRREMDEVLNQEEMLWFQKSQMDAIRDGERNTKYFHLYTIIRRKRNRIEGVKKEDGSWCFDQVDRRSVK